MISSKNCDTIVAHDFKAKTVIPKWHKVSDVGKRRLAENSLQALHFRLLINFSCRRRCPEGHHGPAWGGW
jgi:hypothetical protein